MKKYLIIALCVFTQAINATILYPGETVDISFEPTVGEYGAVWTSNNPTLQLSSVGFLCHVTAQSYFGGSATVTCTYKDRIGLSTYTRTRNWTFTCIDTQISINPISKVCKVEDSFQITYGFNRPTYINPSIYFSGYDHNIIDVSAQGLVTAKSKGTTKIYVKSNIGTNSAICTVNVSDDGTTSTSGNYSTYENWDSSNTMTITLNQAGTLGNYITDDIKYTIKDLTIIGPLNGTDLRLLRDMVGEGYNMNENKTTNGKLVSLDLKDAYFVSGGQWYLYAYSDYYYTSDSQQLPNNLLSWCDKLRRIRFPKYITELSNWATVHCNSLEQINIPPGVTKISSNILCGGWTPMSIQNISIPSSLTEIGEIYNCDYLTEVYCYAQTPPKATNARSFSYGTNFSNGTLYVPKGCAEAYWQAEGWRCFNDIKETLDIYNTLSIHVGSHGIVKYKKETIEMKNNLTYTGYQAFEVLDSESVVVEILPHEGYSISMIKLNDIPIDIPSNTTHVNIGELTTHSKLEILFESANTVENIKTPQLYKVYNLQGNVIARNLNHKGIQSLPRGLYIIKSEKKISKILVK